MAEKYLVAIAVGPDRSSLIAEITSVIADFGCNIEDMDQVVMHGVFILSVLIGISCGFVKIDELKRKLESRCRELGLEVTFYFTIGK